MLQAIMYIMNKPFTNLIQRKCSLLSMHILALIFCLPTLEAQVKAPASKTGKYKNIFKETGAFITTDTGVENEVSFATNKTKSV